MMDGNTVREGGPFIHKNPTRPYMVPARVAEGECLSLAAIGLYVKLARWKRLYGIDKFDTDVVWRLLSCGLSYDLPEPKEGEADSHSQVDNLLTELKYNGAIGMREEVEYDRE